MGLSSNAYEYLLYSAQHAAKSFIHQFYTRVSISDTYLNNKIIFIFILLYSTVYSSSVKRCVFVLVFYKSAHAHISLIKTIVQNVYNMKK